MCYIICDDFCKNFMDISQSFMGTFCGFAWFWLGNTCGASFPVICSWNSNTTQQKNDIIRLKRRGKSDNPKKIWCWIAKDPHAPRDSRLGVCDVTGQEFQWEDFKVVHTQIGHRSYMNIEFSNRNLIKMTQMDSKAEECDRPKYFWQLED